MQSNVLFCYPQDVEVENYGLSIQYKLSPTVKFNWGDAFSENNLAHITVLFYPTFSKE